MNALPLTVPAPAAPVFAAPKTWPVLSQDRAEGVLWYERLMATSAPASGDCARFAAGL